jgi:phosphotransacetylase
VIIFGSRVLSSANHLFFPGTSLAEVRLKLAKEEADAVLEGGAVHAGTSPMSFLLLGMQIEDLQ